MLLCYEFVVCGFDCLFRLAVLLGWIVVVFDGCFTCIRWVGCCMVFCMVGGKLVCIYLPLDGFGNSVVFFLILFFFCCRVVCCFCTCLLFFVFLGCWICFMVLFNWFRWFVCIGLLLGLVLLGCVISWFVVCWVYCFSLFAVLVFWVCF